VKNLASQSALRQYQNVNTVSALGHTDGHRLVQMLFEGSLDRIAAAKGHMQRGEMNEKRERIARVIDILCHLRATLDLDSGEEIARNLNDLYTFMETSLLKANAHNEPEQLDLVADLMREVKSGWDEIPSHS
jgi:flagellar protein FliS